jgi:hypothetical protein
VLEDVVEELWPLVPTQRDDAGGGRGGHQPLPEGWTEHFDATQQRHFYFHAQRNESRWERPSVAAAAATVVAEVTMQRPAGVGLAMTGPPVSETVALLN